jgi:hypothetical protein
MRDLFPLRPFWATFLALRAPADGAGAGAAAADPAPAPAAGDPPAATPAPADPTPAPVAPPKPWHDSDRFNDDERRWLTAKGLAIDDPVEAAVKLLKGHRSAEQRIGKGLDAIMDRPAKDQKYAEWAKANAAALGLPESVEGYKVERPADWPKDLPWNEDLDAKAQALAFENGVPPEVHKAYIGMVADYMKGTAADLDRQMDAARGEMMAELQRDWGKETDAKLTQAKQAMGHFAGEAGLAPEAVDSLMTTLKEKVGDAATMKLFAAIGASMGEDKIGGLGGGGQFGMTPAEANAAIAAMAAPGGELFEAYKDHRDGKIGAGERLKAAQAKRAQLAGIATSAG